MWPAGGGPGFAGQWPINQNMYQNIPHEKIDWAALAQQWIQMRETTGRILDTPHQPCHSQDRPPHMPPFQMRLPVTPSLVSSGPLPPPIPRADPLLRSVRPTDGDNASDWNSLWNTSWGPNAAPSWVPPPPSDNKDNVQQTFDYGHVHGNQGYAAQTYEYNHGTDQIGLNQNAAPDPSQFNYWSGGGPPPPPPPPPFLRTDRNDMLESGGQSPNKTGEVVASTLDASKRKNLPAWIREGLEKMEREKQKKHEREEMIKERERRLQVERESEAKALQEYHALKQGLMEESAPRKSKFDSDSDERSGAESDSKSRSDRHRSGSQRRRSASPFDSTKTEPERLEDLMVKVRKMLTEILLEVTTEEITAIAKEVFTKARAKAPALQLAKSSALESITGGLGVGGYSSDGSDSEDNDGIGGVDSDAELQENIRRRQLEFAQREREMYSDASDAAAGDAGDMGAKRQPSPSREQSEFARKWYEKEEEKIPGLGMTATDKQRVEVKRDEPADARLGVGVDKKEAAATDNLSSRNSAASRSSSVSEDSACKQSRREGSDSDGLNRRRRRRSMHDDGGGGDTKYQSRPDRQREGRTRYGNRSRSRSRSRGRRNGGSKRYGRRSRSGSRHRRQPRRRSVSTSPDSSSGSARHSYLRRRRSSRRSRSRHR